MATPKIAVYSLSDLKNTTDDALPNYLTSLKFRQSHALTDVRLALGYTAVIVAAITFYADYKLGWDATKSWTLWAVVTYFILNGALTFWIWVVEKGKIFIGEFSDTSIILTSSVTKHKPLYNLKVQYGKPGGVLQTLDISAPFTKWFDADGFFVSTPFQQWLASEIPPISQIKMRESAHTPIHSTLTDAESFSEPSQRGKSASDPISPAFGAKSRKSKRTT